MTDRTIFQQLGLPVFQNKVYPTRELALHAAAGDVELVQCEASGLVYNRCFDPSLLQYDADYQNEQAYSPRFKQHLTEALEIVLRHFKATDVGIEVGCGKGYFFELLGAAGATITGFDPAYEGSNPRITKRYFGDDPIVTPPDYVILRHVLEHIPSPWAFLDRLRTLCKGGTKIYVEVPCFDWIAMNKAFYDVFYEHVNYFLLDALACSFSSTLDCGRFFGDQYLYIVADLSSFRVPRHYNGKRLNQIDMDGAIDSLIGRRKTPNANAFIWGAGAKGITLANIFTRRGIPIQALIDINPEKQDKFAGGSGLQIIGPCEANRLIEGADVFVMNPVYLGEVRSQIGDVEANLISVV